MEGGQWPHIVHTYIHTYSVHEIASGCPRGLEKLPKLLRRNEES